MKTLIVALGVLVGGLLLWLVVWFAGSRNFETPAGYVGYVTQGSVFGKRQFIGMQTGPTSSGRMWLADGVNVSVTPYTYDEPFEGAGSILSKDNLKVSFAVHIVFRIREDKIEDFMQHYSTLSDTAPPDQIVQTAYKNCVKESLRTFARDEIQKYDGLKIKENIDIIGQAIDNKVVALTKDTPFAVANIRVGNIAYPPEVADAVSQKLAQTQVLERKATEVEIAKRDAERKVAEAEGIAKAMDIVQAKLTTQYLQHEAIEAQKAMVNSPSHTTIYIPVGNMGVPLVGTVDGPTTQPSK